MLVWCREYVFPQDAAASLSLVGDHVELCQLKPRSEASNDAQAAMTVLQHTMTYERVYCWLRLVASGDFGASILDTASLAARQNVVREHG